jgi:general secretion pathway protein H
MRVRRHGYTLIELLTVIAIIGIIASLLVISIKNAERNKTFEAWLRTLDTVIDYAQDAAILSNKPFGIQFNTSELRFLKKTNSVWQVYARKPLEPIFFPENAVNQLYINGVNVHKGIIYDGISPDVLIDALGTMTPFELQLIGEKEKLTVQYNIAGEMTYEVE